MFGVLVNTFAIIVGAIIGMIFKNILSEKVSAAVMTSMGIATFLIGLKSTLDFVAAMMLTTSLGIGVAFSSIVIFVFEGLIALFAGSLSFLMKNQVLMNEFSAVGNLLVMVIGLNLMGVTKIKVANMLPAIVMVILLYGVFV